MTKYTYRPVNGDDELDALAEILGECFNAPPEKLRLPKVGVENIRYLLRGKTPAGGLWLIPMGQYFGHKSVPMTGIAAVGVATPYRGEGAAHLLMSNMLNELYQQEVPLSALYPASYTLYRKSGYDLAGSWMKVVWDTRALKPARHGLEIRKLGPEDQEAVQAAYARSAQAYNGYLDRRLYVWNRVENIAGEPAAGYGFYNGDTLEGYVYQRQEKIPTGGSDLYLSDMTCTTAASAQAVMTHLWSHSSIIRKATSFCGPAHVLLSLAPEEAFDLTLRHHWMLRISHIESALAQRGYPKVSGELHLEIDDPTISEQSGRYVLKLEDGNPSVRRGGNGDLATDVRGLAQLYSCFIPPRALVQTGLAGGSNSVMDQAEVMFSGSLPGMADMF